MKGGNQSTAERSYSDPEAEELSDPRFNSRPVAIRNERVPHPRPCAIEREFGALTTPMIERLDDLPIRVRVDIQDCSHASKDVDQVLTHAEFLVERDVRLECSAESLR